MPNLLPQCHLHPRPLVLTRAVLPPRGHLEMSGDISGFQWWSWGGVLLACNGSRPVVLLNIYSAQDSFHHKELSSPKWQQCETEEPTLSIMYFPRVYIVSLHSRFWLGY